VTACFILSVDDLMESMLDWQRKPSPGEDPALRCGGSRSTVMAAALIP
jgi:hypothetical protein